MTQQQPVSSISPAQRQAQLTSESPWVRRSLIGVALVFLALFLVLPLIAVFTEALREGLGAFARAFDSSDTWSAVRLTLLTAIIVVPLNIVFGVMAAWAIAKHEFRGKAFLITLIDLPFSISPVVAGLVYVLLYGVNGWLGPLLQAWDMKIIFAVPGIVLVTVFVTFPFIARELIPLMQAQGTEEEQAAIVLGASGLRTFWSVTLPNIKWGLIYGVILCNARAMGEFGAVSVVSGHIRGQTNTIPLHVEILYTDYQSVAAFSVATLLALLALVTLALKTWSEWQHEAQRKKAAELPPENPHSDAGTTAALARGGAWAQPAGVAVAATAAVASAIPAARQVQEGAHAACAGAPVVTVTTIAAGVAAPATSIPTPPQQGAQA